MNNLEKLIALILISAILSISVGNTAMNFAFHTQNNEIRNDLRQVCNSYVGRMGQIHPQDICDKYQTILRP